MIGRVTFEALGQKQTLCLTTRAGIVLEGGLGQPFGTLVQTLQDAVGFRIISVFMAACLNDGKGAPSEVAADIIDEVGFTRAVELVGETLTAAMGQDQDEDKDKDKDEDEGASGNARPTAKKTPAAKASAQ